MEPKQQQKFFFLWFFCFFPSFILAISLQKPWSTGIVLFLIVVLGCVMFYTTLQDATASIASKHWPTASTKISNSNISRRIGSGSKSTSGYRVYVELEYIVDDEHFVLSCNTLNMRYFSAHEQAKAYLEKIKQGEYGSKVFYNPENPKQAYVDPGLHLQHYLAIIVGAAFVVLPIAFATGILEL